MSEVGSAEYWHERFSRCLGVLEETQSQLTAALAKVAELEAAGNAVVDTLGECAFEEPDCIDTLNQQRECRECAMAWRAMIQKEGKGG